jgi:long-chain acyl-CoA synthetase
MKRQTKNIKKFKNIKELLYHSATVYSNHIAFTTKVQKNDDVKYVDHTYSDFLSDVNAFGTSLYKLGLSGKRVAIIGHNCYEWVVTHFANVLGGIVSVPLDKGLQLGELEESLIRSEVEAIVFDPKILDFIEKIKESNKTKIKHFICFTNVSNYLCFETLLNEGKKELDAGNTNFLDYSVDPYSMSILLFTSGTTAKSKAVMLNQYGIVSNIYDMQLVEPFRDTDTNIAFLPLHHIFGLTGMLVMLSSGIRTVFPDGLRYIKQNLVEYKVSLFVGVPILIEKMYSTIIKELKKQKKLGLVNFTIKISNILLKFHIDIRRKLFKKIIDGLGSDMRFIISGGAPLDKTVAKFFNSIGIHLVQGYGLTETSPVISAEDESFIRYGSVGLPMKSLEVKIENPDETGSGEIIVKGPSVMLGYYKDEKQTNDVLKDGWFHTGDLGYLDKDGALFITGRKKDLIVLQNGKKVFPEEIEILVNRLEDVSESFVYALPEKNDPSNVKVAIKVVYDEKVVKSKYKDVDEETLKSIIWDEIKEINKTFPRYKYIKHLILTNKPLIKTSTNKIKRNEELAQVLK